MQYKVERTFNLKPIYLLYEKAAKKTGRQKGKT